MKKVLLRLFFIMLLASCGSNTVIKKSTPSVAHYTQTITATELKTDLYTYAGNEFEGRLTGSEGQKKAVNFLKQRYESLGILAAKTNGDYFQEVPLNVIETPTVAFQVNNNSYTLFNDFVAISNNDTKSFARDEIVYAGYGIEDNQYSSYKNLNVKDKIVIIKGGEPKNNDGSYVISGTPEASKWSNFRQEFTLKRELAESKGVKALLIYNPDSYNRVATYYKSSGSRMILENSLDKMYYFYVNTNLAKDLVPDIDTNTTAQTLNKLVAVSYKNNIHKITSENVAALIKGSEKPNEYVVVSAHLDHEGIKNDEIYNGADDDGSGTVAILEIAEAFKQAVNEGIRPKRSILFLHVTGEEKGLLGSSYYTDVDPIVPLKNTVANLNIDMIGRVDDAHKDNANYVYLIGSDKLSTELHTISEEVNKTCCNITLDYTYNDDNDPNRFYYRSDHYNFAKNNIPVIFYFNGTHEDYHKPSDTPDKINYELLQNRTRLVFNTAWEIANLDHKLVVDKAE